MEWVETTGRTVEEAKDAALDQLGVDEHDAEFEVLAEPKSGLFGRLRQEARVRARVQPKAPRPKQERRDRKRRSGGGGGGGGGRSGGSGGSGGSGNGDSRSGGGGGRSGSSRRDSERPPREPKPPRQPRQPQERSQEQAEGPEGANVEDGPTLEEQAEIVRTFVEGLVDAFAVDATTTVELDADDEVIDARVEGDDVGLLIGPKGQTLSSILELTRTVVQRHGVGARHGRVQLDIGGYRERRRQALERFTRQVAEQVLESGTRKALEPMSAADRKIVHDTVNEIVGVRTISEGEEPRRRVVLEPAPEEG